MSIWGRKGDELGDKEEGRVGKDKMSKPNDGEMENMEEEVFQEFSSPISFMKLFIWLFSCIHRAPYSLATGILAGLAATWQQATWQEWTLVAKAIHHLERAGIWQYQSWHWWQWHLGNGQLALGIWQQAFWWHTYTFWQTCWVLLGLGLGLITVKKLPYFVKILFFLWNFTSE